MKCLLKATDIVSIGVLKELVVVVNSAFCVVVVVSPESAIV